MVGRASKSPRPCNGAHTLNEEAIGLLRAAENRDNGSATIGGEPRTALPPTAGGPRFDPRARPTRPTAMAGPARESLPGGRVGGPAVHRAHVGRDADRSTGSLT